MTRRPCAGGDDLDVEPAAVAFAGVHARGVGALAPVADRDEEPVDAHGGAQFAVGSGLDDRGQDLGQHRQEQADQAGDGRLGAAEQFGQQRLGHVVPQVEQDRDHRLARVEGSAAAPRPQAVRGHAGDEVIDLIAGQAGHTLDPRRAGRAGR